jgi:hypothetical protein
MSHKLKTCLEADKVQLYVCIRGGPQKTSSCTATFEDLLCFKVQLLEYQKNRTFSLIFFGYFFLRALFFVSESFCKLKVTLSISFFKMSGSSKFY